MRILLQDRATSEYIRLDGRTRSAAEAHDFGSTLAALKYCHCFPSADLQILMKFERDEFDVTLPIRAASEPALARG